jgi:hypothetical protein
MPSRPGGIDVTTSLSLSLDTARVCLIDPRNPDQDQPQQQGDLGHDKEVEILEADAVKGSEVTRLRLVDPARVDHRGNQRCVRPSGETQTDGDQTEPGDRCANRAQCRCRHAVEFNGLNSPTIATSERVLASWCDFFWCPRECRWWASVCPSRDSVSGCSSSRTRVSRRIVLEA